MPIMLFFDAHNIVLIKPTGDETKKLKQESSIKAKHLDNQDEICRTCAFK